MLQKFVTAWTAVVVHSEYDVGERHGVRNACCTHVVRPDGALLGGKACSERVAGAARWRRHRSDCIALAAVAVDLLRADPRHARADDDASALRARLDPARAHRGPERRRGCSPNRLRALHTVTSCLLVWDV